jgi:hypothetical protein
MSVESLDQLLQLNRIEIEGRDTNFRQSIRQGKKKLSHFKVGTIYFTSFTIELLQMFII